MVGLRLPVLALVGVKRAAEGAGYPIGPSGLCKPFFRFLLVREFANDLDQRDALSIVLARCFTFHYGNSLHERCDFCQGAYRHPV